MITRNVVRLSILLLLWTGVAFSQLTQPSGMFPQGTNVAGQPCPGGTAHGLYVYTVSPQTMLVCSSGVSGTPGTWTAPSSGSIPSTITQNMTFSGNGAASTPGILFNGTLFTGGTATTTVPYFYINQGATAPTSFSTNGTIIGANAPAAFGGNFVHFLINGAEQFRINFNGTIQTNQPLLNLTNTNNASILAGQIGTVISRNVGDANPSLKVNQLNASSTGDIIQGANNAGIVWSVSRLGLEKFTTVGSITNCSSAAAPAVCGASPAGSVVIAASGTAVTVNTTAVTANSQIFVFPDASLGTKLGVTCDSTAAELVSGLAVTARVAGTSFDITHAGTVTANPLCLSYFVLN